jgi:hypothetical protein
MRTQGAKVAACFLVLAAALVHGLIRTSRTELQVTGMALVLDHVYTIAVATIVFLVCGAVGAWILQHLRATDLSASDQLCLSVTIGMGFLSSTLLLVGWVVGLGPVSVWLPAAIAALVARRHLIRMPGLVRASLTSVLVDSEYRVALRYLVPAVTLLVIVTLLATALTPPTDFDSLMYHLRVPLQWLERGRFFLPADNLHVAQTSLLHMLYLPLLTAGTWAAPAVFNALLCMLLGVCVHSLCRRYFGSTAAGLGFCLLWGNATILLVGPTPRADVVLCLFLVTVHYALILGLGRQGTASAALVTTAGALFGFAFGIKYLALAYGLGLLASATWALSKEDRTYVAPRLILAFTAAALITSFPWLLKNALLLGAPLYPFLSSPMLPPWIEPLYHSRYLPTWAPADSISVLHQIRVAVNLGDFFFNPGRLTPETEGRLYFPCPVIILSPLVFAWRVRTLSGFATAGLLYLATVLFVSIETNLRYLVPGLVALTIAVAGASGTTLAKIKRWRSAITVALVTLNLLPAGLAVMKRMSSTQAASLALGKISRNHYLVGNRGLPQQSYFETASLLNRLLPQQSRVLLLFEARGLYFNASVLQDNLSSNWLLMLPFLDANTCLAETGVTHILVNNNVLRYYVYRGLQPKAISWDRFSQFERKCLTLVAMLPEGPLYSISSSAPHDREPTGAEGTSPDAPGGH